MSQPHHHVFNAIQPQINRGVPVKEVLPLLLQKGVVKPELQRTIERGGMKIVTSYLRNRDFETFLLFVECICIACCDPKSSRKVMSQTLDSIQEVVRDFDSQHGTDHCSRVTAIVKQYIKPATMMEEPSEVEEEEHQQEVVTEKLRRMTVKEQEPKQEMERKQEEMEPAGATAATLSPVRMQPGNLTNSLITLFQFASQCNKCIILQTASYK